MLSWCCAETVSKINYYYSDSKMGKKQQQDEQGVETEPTAKNSKYNRFKDVDTVDQNKKSTWPAQAVVYIGHLPHGFYENQLRAYLAQYGEVLGVKVARSRKTARAKGYAFVQFRYPEVAQIVAETIDGYMLMGKVLVANVLNPGHKNPFVFATSKEFKFINWKRLFMKEKNRTKTPEELKKEVEGLIKNDVARKEKLKSLGIEYSYPGFSALI